MTDKKIVLTTCGNAADAERIARELLDRRIAACVNIVPGLRSLYRWQGSIHDDGEMLLVIKTTQSAVAAIESAFGEIHPYDVPELVVLAIEDGSAAYLAWIAEQVGG